MQRTLYPQQGAAGADSETIRAASTFAISDRDAFLEKVRSASQLRQAEAAKETKRRLNKEKKRISELDTIIKKLYESFAVGRITGERFDSLLADYENEQKALTASVSEMETQMSAFAEDTDRAKQFLELAKKYTDFFRADHAHDQRVRGENHRTRSRKDRR